MKDITIKRSELAVFKSIGKTPEEIAKKYSTENEVTIPVTEFKNAMVKFGLTKSKKTVKEKEYNIILVDDSREYERSFAASANL